MAGERRYYSPGRLVGSVIGNAILLGLGWTLVYVYAIKPLQEYGSIRLANLAKYSPLTAAWWRDFLALAFDVLILVLAVIGTWWVLATIASEAREAGKWRLYYNSPEGKRDRWILKLSAWQRFQHLWVMITFIICAVTGFAARLGFLPLPRTELLVIHVWAGIAMGALMLIHFVYYGVKFLAALARGEPVRKKFPMLEIYSKKFIRDVLAHLLGKHPRDVGKYDPEQLFEYWGVYWGMAVLGIPGILLVLLGPHALDGVLWVMHTKEAVLAVTFILMVHMGYTHFRPKVFPIDTTFLHGKLPLRRIKEEHPEWAKELEEQAAR